METIGSRIKLLRKHLGLNQKEFVKPLNISQGNLSEIENDAYQPSAETLISVFRYYNASVNWVLLGIGDMFIQDAQAESSNKFSQREIDFINLLRKLSPED